MSSSLAVRQFVAFVRGDLPVHQPRNEFRVERMTTAEMYCQKCCGVRKCDMAEGRGPDGLWWDFRICRSCLAPYEKRQRHSPSFWDAEEGAK